jgi:hypothetical protein
MIEDTLRALGFVADEGGTLLAPDSDVTLIPIDGSFYQLTIALADGSTTCVVAKRAVRVTTAVREPGVRVIHEEEDDAC